MRRRRDYCRIPDLLRSGPGRALLRSALWVEAWPLLAPVTALHRRTLARETRLVAVVGSFGKTTTTNAVTLALGRTPHPRQGANSFCWLGQHVLRIRPSDRYAVLEVGIRECGQMANYARVLRPDIAVVTSIGSEHNRALGSLEQTGQEKAEMVRALPPSGLAVLNGDDPNVRWMASQTSARVVTCGSGPDNDVRLTEAQLDWPRGTRCTVEIAGQARTLTVGLLGRHQLFAVLAAVAVAQAEGLDLDDVLARLETLPATRGRLEAIPVPGGVVVLRDELKSGLETVDAALDLLAEIPAGRRLTVLGEVEEPAGSQGPIYRRLGARLAAIVDRAVLVGGAYEPYAVGARRAGLPRDRLANAGRSPLAAIATLREDLQPGDVVLVKGRHTQRLQRVVLALQGRAVRCDLATCQAPGSLSCAACPLLERGQNGEALAT